MILYEKKKEALKIKQEIHFIDAAYVNGYFWTSALEWNGFYRVDMKNKEAKLLGFFEHANVFSNKLFYQVLAYGKAVFFIPWFSDYLVKIDTETLAAKYWKLPKKILSEIAKFRTANIYNKKIFMFPHTGIDICIFDIEKELFECDNTWFEEVDSKIEKYQNDRFIQGYQNDNIVYLPSLCGSYLLKCDLRINKYKIIKFPENEKKIVDIKEQGENKFLILTWKGNVWKYNVELNSKELLYLHNGEEYPYRYVFWEKDQLYLIPAVAGKIIIIKGKEKKVLSYPVNWELQTKSLGIDSIFNGYFRVGNSLLFYPCLGNMLLYMDMGEDILQEIVLDENIVYRKKKMNEQLCETNELLFESKTTVFSFLEICIEKKKSTNTILNYFSGKGIQIWNKMKGC